MDLSIYFEPIEKPDFTSAQMMPSKRLGDVISGNFIQGEFPELSGMHMAIIGVKEERNAVNNSGCKNAPDQVRKHLYGLFHGMGANKIVDLGDIKAGHEVKDTYFALSEVIAHLISNRVVPIIIGGSQDLTYANYMAYEKLGQIINIAAVDAEFDLGSSEEEINSKSYLSKIILHQPNYLFNYTNIGYQTYFVDNEAVDLMRKLYFDTYRLGTVRANMEEVEPVVRNADILSFDVSAIRHSDAPGNKNATPNGFYGEEACQITRYAGLSDKMSSIGFYEINPEEDIHNQTSFLVAEMIWYFIEGYYQRKNDFPFKDRELYKKYIVPIDEPEFDIEFYKSRKSDRWWMKVPCSAAQQNKYERHFMVPCSYADYMTAGNNEIPEKWWQVYHKLM